MSCVESPQLRSNHPVLYRMSIKCPLLLNRIWLFNEMRFIIIWKFHDMPENRGLRGLLKTPKNESPSSGGLYFHISNLKNWLLYSIKVKSLQWFTKWSNLKFPHSLSASKRVRDNTDKQCVQHSLIKLRMHFIASVRICSFYNTLHETIVWKFLTL